MSAELISTPKEFKTQEDLVATIAAISSRVNELTQRPVPEVAGDDFKKLQDELKTVAENVRGLAPKVDALAAQKQQIVLADAGDGEVFPVSSVWDPEPGMASEHYNLLVRTPDELSFAASITGKSTMSQSMSARIREFQSASDKLYIIDELMQAKEEYRNISPLRAERMKHLKAWKPYARLVTELKAAAGNMFDTQTTDQGAEWVPTMFSSLLHEQVRAQLVVAALFDQIPMPSQVYKSPIVGQDMKAFRVAESTEENNLNRPTARTFTTKQMTLTARKLGARVLMSREIEEDSIVPMVPKIIEGVARALAYGVEETILDGDTTSAHMDYDVTSSDDAKKNWKGLRKYALSFANGVGVKDASGGAIKVRDHWMGVRKDMGKYGKPGECVAISGYRGIAELLMAKDDAGNNVVLTVDKYGPGAVIRAGEVGNILGVPLILSDAIREDVDATGVNSNGGPNTFTTVQFANTKAFALGERRGSTVRRLGELYAEYDADAFVGFWRGDFQPYYDMSSQIACGLIIDIA